MATTKSPKPIALDRVPAPLGLDPNDIEMHALLVRDVPIVTAIDLLDDADAFIAQIEEQLKPARARAAALRAIIAARMVDAKATKVAHPTMRVEFVDGKKSTDQRLTVLQELTMLKHPDGTPVIPEADLKKAIWLEVPEPFWKTHLTYLRKLSAYGAEVQAVLERGIVESVGAPQLVIERRPPAVVNVTPKAVR